MITRNLVYSIMLFAMYGVFDIAIPSIVLYPVVKDHEFGFRILFYQIAYLAYLSMMSFALAFFNIYCCFTAWLAFVFLPIGIRAYLDRKEIKTFAINKYKNYELARSLQLNSKMESRRIRIKLKALIIKIYREYIKKYTIHVLILPLLFFIVSNGVGYFHLNTYTYACSDEPTHIYWVACLISKEPFPAGLYPHGEHFVVAQLCSMFGLNVARAWMSFGVVSITVILYSAYLLCYRVFGNKTSGLIGIAFFICSGIFNMNTLSGRLVGVMPMEFAMYAFFVMLYGLVSWGKDQKLTSLIMIGLGLLGTTLIHFFVTIFAVVSIAVYIVVYHDVMKKNKSIHKLALCGILTILLAVLPYVTGLTLFGQKLEQSFQWGASTVSVGSSSDGAMFSFSGTFDISVGYYPITEPDQISPKEMLKSARTLSDYLAVADEAMSSYMTTTGAGGRLLVLHSLLLLLYGVVLLASSKKNADRKAHSTEILFIALAWLGEFVILYLAAVFDVLSLMIPTRSTEFIAFFAIPIFGTIYLIFCDMLPIGKRAKQFFDSVVIIALSVGMVFWTYSDKGITSQTLDYGFTMENIDLQAEEYLVENAQEETWTYISSTNARMAIRNKGYHYEITDLLRCARDTKELYIPTPDIYVVVEKLVPKMGSKLVDGTDYYEKTVPVSAEFANVLLSDVMPIYGGKVNSEVYLSDYNRQVIMSHLYYWMEKFKELYPSEVSVFMEDEGCTIYHIKQDEYFLLNLVLDYSDLVERDLKLLESEEMLTGSL